MKKIKVFGIGILLAVLFSGCKTVNNNYYGTTPPPPRVKTTETIKLSENHDVLRLFISGEGATEQERQLAGRLVFQAKSGVASNRAEVRLDKASADAVLSIRPHLVTVDHDGNYWRLNCELQTELRATNTQRIFAAKSFKFVAQKRVLGLEAAVAQFEPDGGKAVSDWCAKELTKVYDREIGVSLLVIELPKQLSGARRDSVSDNRLIMRIGDELKRMQGLVSYELTGKDEENGTCTYRVVYFRQAYPNGIGTHVSVMVNQIVYHK